MVKVYLNLKINIYIKVNSRIIVLMVLELYQIQMIIFITKVIGKILKNKVKVNKNFQMEIYMKENGKMIFHMVKDYMNIIQVINIKEVFIMVKKMEKEFV